MLRLAALVSLTLLTLQAQGQRPELPAGTSVDANLAYGSHPQTVMDVFVPSGARERRCGVLAIHGGGWVQGTKENVVGSLVVPWLTKGCVVANVEYRLASVAPAPAAVEDVLSAAAWFRRNASRWNVDPERILATGQSAGGHLALMAGLTPKSAKLGPATKIAAVVNIYGITDVEDQIGGVTVQKYAENWVPEAAGRMALARRVSPLSYVRKDAPAVLTLHGTADETVPYEHGVRLTKMLRDAGADAELISVPGAGHGFPKETLDSLYTQIFQFASRRGVLKEAR